MIKKALLAFAFLGVAVASTGCGQTPPAATDTAADQAKLQADALVWFDHFAKGDADGVANLYAEDALLMPPGAAAVTGRPAIKAFLGGEMRHDQGGWHLVEERLGHRLWRQWRRRMDQWNIFGHRLNWRDDRQRQLRVGAPSHKRDMAVHPRYLELGSATGPGASFGSRVSSGGQEVTRAR